MKLNQPAEVEDTVTEEENTVRQPPVKPFIGMRSLEAMNEWADEVNEYYGQKQEENVEKEETPSEERMRETMEELNQDWKD